MPYVSRVCPPKGLIVFSGSKGSNPIGNGLANTQRLDCPPFSMESLAPEEGAAVLGESCTEGRGSLLLNASLPEGASSGSCWEILMNLTDGTTATGGFRFR
jgi:hypothetical protein